MLYVALAFPTEVLKYIWPHVCLRHDLQFSFPKVYLYFDILSSFSSDVITLFRLSSSLPFIELIYLNDRESWDEMETEGKEERGNK